MTVLSVLLAGSCAFGHTELESASPEENAVLAAIPQVVELQFTQPVETSFSLFKVYPLDVELDLPEEVDALEGRESLRVAGQAGSLVTEVLRPRDDAEARADSGLVDSQQARTRTVALAMKANLEPGAYVVMWRALATDSHATEGYYVFIVRGDEP